MARIKTFKKEKSNKSPSRLKVKIRVVGLTHVPTPRGQGVINIINCSLNPTNLLRDLTLYPLQIDEFDDFQFDREIFDDFSCFKYVEM